MSDFMPPSGDQASDKGADRPTQSEEVLDSHGGDSFAPAGEPTAPKARRTGLIIGGALAAVALVGAAAWGAAWLLNDGPDAAEALPAGTLGFVSINFDPSGEQKLEAMKTLQKFPGLKDKLDFDTADDVRKHIFEEIQSSGECPDVDYGKDIGPWLGNGMAVAAVDAGEDQPSSVGVIEVTDQGKARDGFDKLATCDQPADEFGLAFNGDWAIVAETQEIADQVVADTESGSLGDDTNYQNTLENAGDSGIVTMYVAPAAAGEIIDFVESEGMMSDYGGTTIPEDAKDEFVEGFKGFGGVVRFHDGALEFEGAGEFTPQEGSALDLSNADGSQVVASLPDDTAFAMGMALPKGWIQFYLDAMASSLAPGQTADELMAEIEQQTGLELPEDLEALLGESLAVAVSSNLDVEQAVTSGDASGLEVGVKVKGDAAKADAVLDKLRPQLGQQDYLLGSKGADGYFAVGPNSSYLDTLLADGGLGDSQAFTEVVPHARDSAFVLFLNFDAGANWLVNALKDADAPAEVTDNVEPLGAIGMSSWVDGSVSHVLFKITTN